MKLFKNKKEKGFTIIELMIVAIIIGLLSAIAIPKYINLMEKANLGATLGNLAAIRGAVSIYYGSYLVYPTNIDPQINSLMDDTVGDELPYVKSNYPPETSPRGNSVTLGEDSPTTKGRGWYYNYIDGKVYINSIATDIKGNIYSTY